ncbi:hypothetical protein LXA43DRAFT_1072153 [Ganoderma leucocontextum]|nr:hypothetical protein LXA43DRAFT_1072153 [Ganoderma leucocontextum]
MPPPAIYVAVAIVGVAAVIAFHQFVYEPVIAPKLETWAENFVEKRKQKRQQQQKQKQRQNPVPAQPVNAHSDESKSARSTGDKKRADDANGMSIELERLAERERDEWRHSVSSSGLRHRRPTAAPEEADTPIHYPVMEPTHVIVDPSAPSSPGGQSIRTSALPSVDNSPAYPSMSLSEPSEPQSAVSKSPTPSPQVMSPKVRLPTPMSDDYLPSPRTTPPNTMLLERSPLSMRQPPADLSASLPVSTSYNTPLGGSLQTDAGGARAHTDPLLNPEGSRVQSPFSDIYSVDARAHSPEYFSPAGAHTTYPEDVRSPSMASDLTLDSDEEFDVMSPHSGMFSPSSTNVHVDDDPFEVGSQHGSEVSWTSVGRHSPTQPF